jgi:hypothetical protein
MLVTALVIVLQSLSPCAIAQCRGEHDSTSELTASGSSSEIDSMNVRVISNFRYLPDDMQAYGIDLEDSLVFIADQYHGLRVISVSDPARPYEIGSGEVVSNAAAVEVTGDYAFVGSWTNGLQVFSLQDLSHPALIGSYDSLAVEFVTLSGSYAYVADWYGGPIKVLSITDPSNPLEIGHYDAYVTVQYISIHENYAFCAYECRRGTRRYSRSRHIRSDSTAVYQWPGVEHRHALGSHYKR